MVAPSLCERWTNHEVLAHLVVGLGASLPSMAGAWSSPRLVRQRERGDGRGLAASRSPTDLLDDFAALSRRTAGLGRYFPPRLLLGDHVTHELDMVFALDREPDPRRSA